jgi:hypothetical protein
MAFNYQTGGDTTTGGSRLTEPGTYHQVVTEITDQPTKKDGSLIPNAAFAATLGVLDGTTPGQKDKSVNLIFFNGKVGEPKSEAFAKKKMDRFFMAVGMLTPQQVESEASVSLNLPDAIGRQLVAKYEKNKPEDKFVDLSFADIYHVDDAAVKEVPKDVAALKLIDAKLRWPNGQPPAAPKSEPKPTAAAAASTTSFDDL